MKYLKNSLWWKNTFWWYCCINCSAVTTIVKIWLYIGQKVLEFIKKIIFQKYVRKTYYLKNIKNLYWNHSGFLVKHKKKKPFWTLTLSSIFENRIYTILFFFILIGEYIFMNTFQFIFPSQQQMMFKILNYK